MIKADIAASFQQAVIDVLTRKIKKAVEVSGRSDVIIAGGIAWVKNIQINGEGLGACSVNILAIATKCGPPKLPPTPWQPVVLWTGIKHKANL